MIIALSPKVKGLNGSESVHDLHIGADLYDNHVLCGPRVHN